MAFNKKTWKDQLAQYTNRYDVTPVTDGTTNITRHWGNITQVGDKINASTMNDLENRIENADATNTNAITSLTNRTNGLEKEVANIKEALNNSIIEEVTDTTSAYKKEINALPYGVVNSVGGMTRKGKNIATFKTDSPSGGLSITYDGSEFVIDGTSTSQAYIGINSFIGNGVYTYSFYGDMTNTRFTLVKNGEWGGDITENGGTKTINTSSDTLEGYFFCDSGVTFNNARYKVQVEKGSVATDYEPYTTNLLNGDVYEFVTEGRNLLNPSVEYLYGFAKENNTYTNSVTDAKNPMQLCIFVMDGSTITHDVAYTYDYVVGQRFIRTFTAIGSGELKINHNGNERDIVIYTGIQIEKGKTYSIGLDIVSANPSVVGGIVLKNIKLEYGQPTDFTPYSQITHELPTELLNLPCYGMGVNDANTEVRLTSKKYRNMKSVDLGSLDWSLVAIGSSTCFNANYDGGQILDSMNFISEKYSAVDGKDIYYGTASDKTINIGSGWSGGRNSICVLDSSFTSATDFKNAMNGVILHYETQSGGTDYDAYIYTQRVNRIKLNGTEYWNLTADGTNERRFDMYSTTMYSDSANEPNAYTYVSNLFEPTYVNINSGDLTFYVNSPFIVVNDKDSRFSTLAEFKSYLASNNLEIVYKIKSQRVYDITDIVKDYVEAYENIVETDGSITFENTSGYPIDVPSSVTFERKL